jgi:hypothetical protein
VHGAVEVVNKPKQIHTFIPRGADAIEPTEKPEDHRNAINIFVPD